MQSAQPRQVDNIALVWRFDRAAERAILVERSVAAIVVIIGQIIREHLTQMLRIENDEVVQTFAANRANDPFDHGILPRRARGNELLFQAQSFDSTLEIRAIDGIAIPQQIMRRDRVGESFDNLLCCPGSRGRLSDIEMQDFATLMVQHQKDIEHPEGGGWDGKEIHCDHCLGMVLKEAFPGLV